ncbi:phosphoribosyltransferase [Alicyclobacillus fastidiosus]|uniref:Phosphoribosyltransferase n=1 Tax=Alicyclobacillus fastidiosus TaxID=392011 RepID=A0ABY6ZKI5_9BACL|nr:phosphoribosyltransferase [Alicyclobacillus fastidiosus]WAH43098.1 phosphoribosyltransferase [Alicyclobacillus fastidiosus]GMA65097.1 hypothetical protein GCM10025859_55370 [Alicyclobacillus fastidiosus]
MDNRSIKSQLLSRLIYSNAIRVRHKESELPFWYTSGKPGAFYINVEKIAGESVSVKLDEINDILASDQSRHDMSTAITKLIVRLLDSEAEYAKAMHLLTNFYTSTGKKPNAISGGERRDWFFSIPIARQLGVPHVFLFKDGSTCTINSEGTSPSMNPGTNVIHVSDIVNTGSSYKRYWLPALARMDMLSRETYTVVIRGTEGLNLLKENNVSVVSPLTMDADAFHFAYEIGLINRFALDDVQLYLESPREWTRQLLKTSEEKILLHAQHLDDVQKERLSMFLRDDPYGLAEEFPRFFNHTVDSVRS